jgi:hypothetical protein
VMICSGVSPFRRSAAPQRAAVLADARRLWPFSRPSRRYRSVARNSERSPLWPCDQGLKICPPVKALETSAFGRTWASLQSCSPAWRVRGDRGPPGSPAGGGGCSASCSQTARSSSTSTSSATASSARTRLAPSCGPRRLPYMVELRVEVVPGWSFRLPLHSGRDGVLRCRGGVLERLLHIDDRAAIVRGGQLSQRRVLFGAWAWDRADAQRRDRADALRARRRRRPAPVLRAPPRGPAHRSVGTARALAAPHATSVAFEALAWAICEQLIQRLRDAPSAAALAAVRRRGWRPATSPPGG